MKHVITAPATTADRRLEAVSAAQYSSRTLYFDVRDDEIEALNVRIFRTPDPATGEARTPYVAVATLQEDGFWRCYLTPLCFSDVASDLKYDLIGVDSQGNSRHLGVGTLRVLTSHLTEDGRLPDIIPQDTYIYNPVTGLYHKLVAEVDESGVITTAVEQEGVER